MGIYTHLLFELLVDLSNSFKESLTAFLESFPLGVFTLLKGFFIVFLADHVDTGAEEIKQVVHGVGELYTSRLPAMTGISGCRAEPDQAVSRS